MSNPLVQTAGRGIYQADNTNSADEPTGETSASHVRWREEVADGEGGVLQPPLLWAYEPDTCHLNLDIAAD